MELGVIVGVGQQSFGKMIVISSRVKVIVTKEKSDEMVAEEIDPLVEGLKPDKSAI